MSAVRHLRPAHLQVVAGEVWAVDEVQPVAAVVDPGSGRLRRLVGWPAVPAASETHWQGEWRALSDGEGLWVQAGHGPVARVTPAGAVTVATVRVTTDTAGLRLVAAGAHGAWLVPPPPPQDLAHGPDAPAPARGWSPLLVAAADGSVREVVVQAPVVDIVGSDAGVHLQVETGTGTRRHLGAGTWEWVPELRWVTLPWSAGVPDALDAPFTWSPAPRVLASAVAGRGFGWHPSEDREDPALDHPGGTEPAAGATWELGWVRGPVGTPRGSVATSSTGTRVVLGAGTVRAAVGRPDALWVAFARPADRAAGVGAPAPVDLLQVVGDRVDVVLPADSVDVTAHCRPLGPRPVDHDSYARFWLRTWADASGAVRPVEEGVSGGHAQLVGRWPETTIEVTFDWAGRPGVRLRRRVRLFDELGRHTPPEHSTAHLAEDLATGRVPEARGVSAGGVLDA
ncbi:hypothetical protein [Geodermatophilus sp. DSM 44513]|uniref:hypothetical protein n=1 Tax=Geodermatophilus sp. DSM 44513 TaxID=1528104 RepID=UPI0012816EDF|nr:hypothetical protein [Geodermatophilus sp. DSM 44513]WNV74903.1 hypothetical protein RTG05_18180 [Geodermatophilus sp. DSM 44513]